MNSIIHNFYGGNRPHATVLIGNHSIIGLLDSGATCSILGKNTLEIINKLKIKKQPYSTIIKTADGTSHSVNCILNIPYTFNKITKIIPTLYVPTISKSLILGMDFWESFNIRPVICNELNMITEGQIDLAEAQKEKLAEIISTFKFPEEGEPLGRTNVLEHHIDTGNAGPIKQRHYPVSPFVQTEMDEELERMLKLGVIEKSFGAWSSPIVGVRKSSGKLRLCLDCRKVNEVSKTDAFPLPYISRILGRLRGTKYLSSIDLSDAFWQIPLAKEDREKTAFTVPGRGLYQFTVMPFGLHGAPMTMSRLMDSVLGYDLEPLVFVYLDDIIIATETFEDHIRCMEEVSARLKKANLSISLKKSKFCMEKLEYLGYVISQNGISVNLDKVSAILNYPPPKNVRGVRRLIGMVGWYRRFIPDFATIVSPITDLLKKIHANKFKWTEAADKSFNLLKTVLISAPVLSTPDFTIPFVIHCDASDAGVGAVLVQGSGDSERVIAYMSQKLTSAQTKYTTTEKECLAVILAVEKFRPYIEGTKFTVITDHASLLWLKNLKDPSGRLSRWALRLQHYEYVLLHRKGKLNVVPDALSRSVESIELITDEVVDEDYLDLIKRINDLPEECPGFKNDGGVVYKYVRDNATDFSWKLVVPKPLRPKILLKCHDSPTSSHGGINKTVTKIKNRYYWPGMTKQIKEYIKKCEVCQLNKPSNVILRGEMGKPKDPQLPWKMLSVDLIGPLPRSKNGNSNLLVVLDVFSKFVLLKPLKKATAATVSKFLEENVFLMFGVPEILICDNGSQFIAKSFKSFLQDYNVKLWYTASYLPQTNPVERVNRSIKAALRSYTNENHRDWDVYINHIGCALRTAVHTATKYTPYYLNFGKEIVTDGQDYQVDDKLSDLNGKSDRIKKLKSIREKITGNLLEAYKTYSERYNLRSRKISFKVGDIVLKRNFILSDAAKGITASLNPVFVKCIVKEKVGTNCYRLKNMAGKDIGVFGLKDLKVFYS